MWELAEVMVLPAEGRAPFVRADAARAVLKAVPSASPLDAMVREHEAALVAFATKLCGGPADARDLVQDTLERALRRYDTFTAGTNARAWLFAILHNAFIDRCRRRSAAPRSTSIEDVELAASEPQDPPPWTSLGPEQVTAAIARLEPEFRSVYELHAAGLSYLEIASRLGIPTNTVGTRLARARRKLRALLELAILEMDPAERGAQ